VDWRLLAEASLCHTYTQCRAHMDEAEALLAQSALLLTDTLGWAPLCLHAC
jgi:hypothetical protein